MYCACLSPNNINRNYVWNADNANKYIDLAKPKSGTPHYNKLTITEKRICFSWIRNSKNHQL